MGLSEPHILTLLNSSRRYLILHLYVRISLQLLERDPHLLSDVTSLSHVMGRAKRVEVDESRGYAIHGGEVLVHSVVCDVWRDHVVAGRIVVDPDPAHPAEQGVKDSLVNMPLYIHQIESHRRSSLKNVWDVVLNTLFLIYSK